jgi:hypothetical protein
VHEGTTENESFDAIGHRAPSEWLTDDRLSGCLHSLISAVHPLLVEPTPDQARLLDAIYEGRKLVGWPAFHRTDDGGMRRVGAPSGWPTFQYIEWKLYRDFGIEAGDVLASLPIVRGVGGAYGWVWHHPADPLILNKGSTLTLTVGGMAHVLAASEEVTVFLDMLRVMVANERSIEPRPDHAREVDLSGSDVHGLLARAPGGWSLDQTALDALGDILKHEPATWHSHPSAEPWRVSLTPFLRAYNDIGTVKEYLARVAEQFAPPRLAPDPLYPSPLSLPETIDYLNAVWRSHAGRPLLTIGRAEAAAKLVLDCGTAEEFESRLSGLCMILDALNLPEGNGHKLSDLAAYLDGELGEESAERASEAIADLRGLFSLRRWRQHAGTEGEALRGMSRLGISLPIYNWGDTWRHVQARAVVALSALREEVETLVP